MDVGKYLERIGINEKLVPSIGSLKSLQKAHLFNVPFENLDIHYGKKIILDTSYLYSKIVKNKRGGFCYELNSLFHELLSSLGFNVKIISANVFNNESGYGKNFDHMALIVTIANVEYLSDVGFGDFCYEPLKIQLNERQQDITGEYYFDLYDNNMFRVIKIEKGENIPQYIFSKTGRQIGQFSNMCRYHQTSSDSHFTKKRIITLPTENGRITLSSEKLKITENGLTKTVLINNENEFKKYLWQHFNIKNL